MVACFWRGARSQTLRTFISICEAVPLAVPPMFIFVRSLFPNVGWHARVSYSDDYSKRVLGSDQHCCRKPTYYEPCKRERNVFLLQPAARVSFRSCCGSVLLDGSFWPCGLCLLLRVGSASGFPEACPQVLSPSATTRQAPWRGKKCAYLWRRAPPRARPRDVGSWQHHPSCVAGTLTPQACHRHFQGSNSKPIRNCFGCPASSSSSFFRGTHQHSPLHRHLAGQQRPRRSCANTGKPQ